MPSTPSAVTLYAYPVGFGDCFLLALRYPDRDRHVLIDFGSTEKRQGQPADLLLRIAADVKARCGGKLAAVVATHRHRDHISGFATSNGKGPGDLIAACQPDVVLQPWTEDPRAAPDASAPTKAVAGPRGFVRQLADMHRVADRVRAEARLLGATRGALSRNLVEELDFLGGDNLADPSAVDNLVRMADKGRGVYAYFGAKSGLDAVLPGVRTRVLGPPTLEQSEAIRQQRRRDADEFWQLMGLSAVHLGAGQRGPFPPAAALRGATPTYARWLRKKILALHGNQLLQIVRSLDEQMNNTSLILLFEIGRCRLLFPGDAQIENWSYALEKAKKNAALRKRLQAVSLYKVGHHGSLNATPRSLWALFDKRAAQASPDRLCSVVSTLEGKHGKATRGTEVPRRTLVEALERETTYVTTQKLRGKSHLPYAIDIDVKKGTFGAAVRAAAP